MRGKSFVLIFVGVLFLALLYNWVGVGRVVTILASVDPWLLAPCSFFGGLIVVLAAYRWRSLLNSLGYSTRLSTLVQAVLLGLTANNITPSARTGGEPVRVYLLHKTGGVPIESGFATVVGDRILDGLSLILVSSTGFVVLLIFGHATLGDLFGIVVAISFLGSIIMVSLYISFSELLSRRTTNFFIDILAPIIKKFYSVEKLRREALDAVKTFHSEFKVLSKKRRVLIPAFVSSCFLWGSHISIYYLVFLSVGHPVGLPHIMVFTLLLQVVAFTPITPGGIGLTEGVGTMLYTKIGVPLDVSAAAMTLARVFTYFLPTISGLVLAPIWGVKLSRIKEMEKVGGGTDTG